MTNTPDVQQNNDPQEPPTGRSRRTVTRTVGARQTEGYKLLAAILRDGSTASLRQISARWFTEEETPAYEFIDLYYRRFNSLPSEVALSEQGIVLPVVQDSTGYYIDRCENRAMYAVVHEHHGEYSAALQAANMREVFRLMRLMLAQGSTLQSRRDISPIELEAQQMLQTYREDRFRVGLKGVTTGYPPVDEHTNGLQGGDVGILVARPNIGKTYTLLFMVIAAWLSGRSILFVSMEMTTQQIVKRIVAIMARINPHYLNNGRLSVFAQNAMVNTINGFADLPPLHFVAGRFRKTVSDIDNYVLEVNPDAVYIDGGYLVGSNRNGRSSSKAEKLTEVMEDIKAMAVDRDRPVMTTVQFNREVRKNTKGAQDLAQIAGTDAIGQIATLVLGMQLGPAGQRTTTRIVEMLKNREGELIKFLTNFSFSPIDFSYLGLYEDEQIVEENEAAAHSDTLRRSMV